MIDVSIVIVSWNSADVLGDCLASIERELLGRGESGAIVTETIVVDNHSPDDTAELVRERFPWAEIVPLAENRGFAGGNNAGTRHARGRYVLSLNPDTIVRAGAIERCVAHLDSHPEVGAAGLQLLNEDGTLQNSIHAWPSLLTELVPTGLREYLAPRRFPSKRYAHTEPIEVEAVLGAFLIVRRAVLEEVGLMSEDYFLYLEETDWCWRIARAGWKIHHVPDARIVHRSGATTKKKRHPVEPRIELHRSLYHFFRKNRGALQAAVVVCVRFIKSLLYVIGGALPALFSARNRPRFVRDATLVAWHLRGCPLDGWGYPRERPLGPALPRLDGPDPEEG